MNAHQRRKAMRRIERQFPHGTQVRVTTTNEYGEVVHRVSLGSQHYGALGYVMVQFPSTTRARRALTRPVFAKLLVKV